MDFERGIRNTLLEVLGFSLATVLGGGYQVLMAATNFLQNSEPAEYLMLPFGVLGVFGVYGLLVKVLLQDGDLGQRQATIGKHAMRMHSIQAVVKVAFIVVLAPFYLSVVRRGRSPASVAGRCLVFWFAVSAVPGFVIAAVAAKRWIESTAGG